MRFTRIIHTGGALNLDFTNERNYLVLLRGNVTALTVSGLSSWGLGGRIGFKQDSVGSRTVAVPVGWVQETGLSVTSTPASLSVWLIQYQNTSYHAWQGRANNKYFETSDGVENVIADAGAGSDTLKELESADTNILAAIALKADIASPTFTGDPKAPTPSPGDNDTSIATTAFVTAAVATAGSGYQPLDSDLTALAALTTTSYGRGFNTLADSSAALTYIGTLSTAAIAAAYQPLDADLTAIAALATTSFGRGFLIRNSVANAQAYLNLTPGTDIYSLTAVDTLLALKAPLASPTFTGTPSGPTAAALTNTTQFATTAFVTAANVAFAAASHTWASTQTFTVAPVFTDASGTRTALGLGTLATQSGTFSGTHSGTSSGTNTGDQTITLTGQVTGTGTGSFATVLVTAQPDVHTWAATQTFTVAPVFTDASGTRTALGLGTAATASTGTSGATVPLLNGANTHSGRITASAGVTISSGDLRMTPTALTIAAGVITVTGSYHTVDTEAAAAIDDLDTINGGSDGQILILKCAIGSRDVVVKNNTGNIRTGGADFTLVTTRDRIMLQYDNANAQWMCISKITN
jgi:hypothetical protein